MLKFLIYGLVDPRDGCLRYIGKSSSGLARPMEHRRPSKQGLGYKGRWIRDLYSMGLTFSVVVLQELPDKGILNQAEIHWIAYFRALGCKLTNLTDGGDGAPPGPKSAEYRAKFSAGMMGHRNGLGPRSEAARQSMKVKHWSKDPERRAVAAAHISAGLTGRVLSEEIKRKISTTVAAQANEIRARLSKPIVDHNGIIYSSILEAARKLGLQDSKICMVLKGKRRHTGGYRFSYLPPSIFSLGAITYEFFDYC